MARRKRPKTPIPPLSETLVFLVHAVKQFCFGFETMNDHADEYEEGSAAMAFYMNAIYNHIVAFYLLDKEKNDPMGGSFHKALKLHGLEDALKPIREILESPVGSTTFGEVVRVFRNKVAVHTSYLDRDLDRIYEAADMHVPENVGRFHDLLLRTYQQTKLLPIALIERAGLDPADFGITVLPTECGE